MPFLEDYRAFVAPVEATLVDILAFDAPSPLIEAMRYSTLSGGKRVRPVLTVAWSDMLEGSHACAVRAGCAIELVHTYSLIHDDLPCMDDDSLRRGQPTCHKKFDDMTATLAGDALQSLAFEVISDPKTHKEATVRTALVQGLAKAIGAQGMAGGQMLDMAGGNGGVITEAQLSTLQSMKTGALIHFSARAGAMVAGALADDVARAGTYGQALGALFQITDDMLDVEGSSAQLGKTAGKDAATNKVTYVTLLGLEAAKKRADTLVSTAHEVVDFYGEKAGFLRDMVDFVRCRVR